MPKKAYLKSQFAFYADVISLPRLPIHDQHGLAQMCQPPKEHHEICEL